MGTLRPGWPLARRVKRRILLFNCVGCKTGARSCRPAFQARILNISRHLSGISLHGAFPPVPCVSKKNSLSAALNGRQPLCALRFVPLSLFPFSSHFLEPFLSSEAQHAFLPGFGISFHYKFTSFCVMPQLFSHLNMMKKRGDAHAHICDL